jgi:hypothetical protein
MSLAGPSPMPRLPSAASAYREHNRRRMLCSIRDPSSAYNLCVTNIAAYTNTGNEAPDGRLRARRRPVLRKAAAAADIIWRMQLTHKRHQGSSITASVMARSCGGTSMPSALAVRRLIKNSNLVACWTGRSAGLTPLRMRPI